MLFLQDFEGIYDGTNDLMRRTFCMLVYDNEYKAPNGRGYVMLRPAQDERKEFSPPLASLPDLRLTLAKPNGTLFNNSADAYTVSLIQYEPQNRLFIKVVLDQFFDRNEYWVGDYVRLTGFSANIVAATSSSSASIAASPGYLATLIEYVNRAEGFEIVQLGGSNGQGFYNSFYVLAPGVLDQVRGTVLVDTNLISTVLAMGSGAGDPSATVAVSTPGVLLNMSLQPVITMRIGTRLA